MITSDDRELLGMPPEQTAVRRSSSVSQALRAIRDDVDLGMAAWELTGLGADESLAGTRLLVACDRATRQRAYALAHRVYQSCGYLPPEAKNGWAVSTHDAYPQTVTLLVEDAQGHEVATISLVFDSPAGLPCDEIYAGELSLLRAQGRLLVEVTRLAIAEEFSHSKTLLVRLFNFIYIFARRVRGFDDFVIEVNPRHVNYYRRLLRFEIAGPERPCPRVLDAPAVLLRLDLSVGDREVLRVAGKGAAAQERTLYPYFYTWLEEGAVAEFLARHQKPMTAEDARYFGLEQAPAISSAILTGADTSAAAD